MEALRWDRLYETASVQEGMFTTEQAAAAGYSPQLLVHHVKRGRILRVQRRLYRLVHFPYGTDDDLVAAWLWSEQTGVLSHDTALAARQLSDLMPSRTHLTLPVSWRKRRVRIPDNVVVHYGDVPAADRAWHGAVPMTSVRRTLNDCALGISPEFLIQATHQALQRGLVKKEDLPAVAAALTPYGGMEGLGDDANVRNATRLQDGARAAPAQRRRR